MKTKILPFFLFLLFLLACVKEKSIQTSKPSIPQVSLSFMDVNDIPNEIVPLLYKDLVKDKLFNQAETLSDEYYKNLSKRKDGQTDLLNLIHGQISAAAKVDAMAAANLPTHSVSGVGVVLSGDWFQVGTATTSANLQAIGWVDINFNAMNGGAPDAFSTTAPSASQIMGTVNQQRRLEAYQLPTIQFGAVDNLGTTYFSSSFGFTYAAYVQVDAWQSYKTSGQTAGTVGLSRRMEAIRIYGPRYTNNNYTVTFNDSAPSTQARPYIYYRVHQESYGWHSWVGENDICGITGNSKRIEAIQIRAYLIKI